jgi:hypothetical protein
VVATVEWPAVTERRATRLAVAALGATTALLAVGGVIYATGTEFALTDVLDAGLFAAVGVWLAPVTIPERPSGRKEV